MAPLSSSSILPMKCVLLFLSLRLCLSGGEGVLSYDVILRLSLLLLFSQLFSFSSFESLDGDSSGGIRIQGSNFGDIELERDSEI